MNEWTCTDRRQIAIIVAFLGVSVFLGGAMLLGWVSRRK